MKLSFETITFHVTDRVAYLTLKRPPINILNIQMMVEISNALLSIREEKDLHALVIRAEGKAFSAGLQWKITWETKLNRCFMLFIRCSTF